MTVAAAAGGPWGIGVDVLCPPVGAAAAANRVSLAANMSKIVATAAFLAPNLN